MTSLPSITETQLQLLRALLAKKGWSKAYFAWKTNIALADLTTSQARDWITKLTKETKGKPRPPTLLEPPETLIAVTPQHTAAADAPVAPADTAASPAPPGPDIEGAAATMI